ncbi:putative nudC domain-containing protein 2 [Penaeus vannamei]|uniref:Putative nudC domain-containing protein 2 n=1 Tax=Penaeus vannamei TaxID=6689 RepID=A0A3R7SNJ0_PENVA|nr:putative nudC domain-containing protein 2 [Penaeus vannamei]
MPDYVETNFDERSGFVPCATPWGRWWQTVAEVHVEVTIPEGTRSKFIQVTVKPSHMKVVVLDKVIIESLIPTHPLFPFTPLSESLRDPYLLWFRTDETIWTIEDKKILHIAMTKADACTRRRCGGGC